jgi:hypothetical protein
MYEGPGIYRHYKGGEYFVLGLALHEHGKDHNPNFDPMSEDSHQVIYKPRSPGSSLFGSPATMWIRKLTNFNKMVDNPHDPLTMVPRFQKIEDV